MFIIYEIVASLNADGNDEMKIYLFSDNLVKIKI